MRRFGEIHQDDRKKDAWNVMMIVVVVVVVAA